MFDVTPHAAQLYRHRTNLAYLATALLEQILMITCITSSAASLELSAWGELIDCSRSRQLRGYQEIRLLCRHR